MKFSKIFLIILILLLITGAGMGAYFYFNPQTKEGGENSSETSSPFPEGSDNFNQTGVVSNGEGSFLSDVGAGVFVENLSIPQLRKIAVGPIAGTVIHQKEGGLTVRYIEKETGHVFDAYATSSQTTRITNTTIPRIQKALFTPQGDKIVLQYLSEDKETIETFLADIEKGEEVSEDETQEENEGSLQGEFLSKNISALSINEAGSSLFYLAPTESGSEAMVVTLKNNNMSRVFNHPLTEWSTDYISNNTLALTTKPSGLFAGFLYSVNSSGVFSPLLREVLGLSAVISPNENYILYSESVNNTFILKLFDTEEQKSEELPLRALAEKCVWSEKRSNIVYCAIPNNIDQGIYPDVWYQGRVSFSDSLWEIDTQTHITKLLIDPVNAIQEAIDMVNVSFSPEEDFFIFTNKKDSSLWGLLLPQSSSAVEETN